MKLGWQKLRSKLDLESETELGLYLGCQLVRGQTKLKDGTKVSTITYDMESFLEQSVQKYLEIVGKDVSLKSVPTPSLPEEAKDHPARAPCGRGSCQSVYLVRNSASHHGTHEIQVGFNQQQCRDAGR